VREDGDDAAPDRSGGPQKNCSASRCFRRSCARSRAPYALDIASVRVVDEGVDLERYRPRARCRGTALRKAIELDETDQQATRRDRTRGARAHPQGRPEIAKERPKARFCCRAPTRNGARGVACGSGSGGSGSGAASAAGGPSAAAGGWGQLVIGAFEDGALTPFKQTILPMFEQATGTKVQFLTEPYDSFFAKAFQDGQSLYRELAAWTRPERVKEGSRLARATAEAHGQDAQALAMIAIVDEVAASARRR
jgi:hypothetical protein